jgi:hypothetical protein
MRTAEMQVLPSRANRLTDAPFRMDSPRPGRIIRVVDLDNSTRAQPRRRSRRTGSARADLTTTVLTLTVTGLVADTTPDKGTSTPPAPARTFTGVGAGRSGTTLGTKRAAGTTRQPRSSTQATLIMSTNKIFSW